MKKVFSKKANQNIGVSKDAKDLRRQSGMDLAIFTEEELGVMKGCPPAMARAIIEAKIIFNGEVLTLSK